MNPYLKTFVEKTFPKPENALDLGAGDMTDVLALRDLGWDCVGVDKLTGVDLEALYLDPNRPFSLVYSHYVWHKLHDKTMLVRTAYENLKKEGWFFVHTFGDKNETSSSPFSEDYTRELLEQGGFDVVSLKQFPLYEEEHRHTHHIVEVVARKK